MKPLDWRIKRISRLYYWVAWVIHFFVEWLFALVWFMCYLQYGDTLAVCGALLVFGMFNIIYMALLNIKRFHDAGYGTGYCIFCMVLSFFIIGEVLLLAVAIKESDGDNQWGKNQEKLEYEKNRTYYAR